MPARLTASVHHSAAHADIVDIERDVDLGGSIHAKGVLIMSSYLKHCLQKTTRSTLLHRWLLNKVMAVSMAIARQ